MNRRLIGPVVLGLLFTASAPLVWAQPAPAASAPEAVKPKIHPSRASVEQLLKIGVPIAPVIAPDGTAYMRERHKGVFQLYRREAGAGPSGKLQRLTAFTDGISGYSLSPDGRTLLITAARGGSEQTRIYRLDPKAEKLLDESAAPILQPGPDAPVAKGGIQYAASAWMRDSSGFFFRANDREPENFWLYRYDLADGKITPVLKKAGSWSVGAPTRDGARLLVSRFISNGQSEVYTLDVASGELKDLTLRDDEGQPVSNSIVGFLPGEREALVLSDYQTGADGLWIIDLQTGKPRAAGDVLKAVGITSPELDSAVMSFEGDLLAIIANEQGRSRLAMVTLPDFAPVTLPPIAEGLVSLSQLRARRAVISCSTSTLPGLSYLTTIGEDRRASALEPLTVADDMGVDLTKFSTPTLVEYTSFDGLKVPAWLYLPEGRTPGDAGPELGFVVDFHGGPEGQSRPGFNREYAILNARGYGVLAPNVRGSTGYGRAYRSLDDYTKRWDSVKDGVWAAKWLVQQRLARPGHISTRGGSYGGFMAVAVLIADTQTAGESGQGRLYGAGIQSVGIVNFRTFLEQTADYRRKLREVEYGPLTDTEFLTKISPITMVDQVKAPMMIVHGLNDPRVPVGEAMQLAIALQKKGMDPELLYYPDEGHGVAKTPNRVLLMERTLRFLDRTIAPPPPVPTPKP